MKAENTQWQEPLTQIDEICVGGAKTYYLETDV